MTTENKTNDDLKPCPFCGGDVHVSRFSGNDDVPYYKIYCSCLSDVDENSIVEVIKAWNARAALTEHEAVDAAEVKGLKDALRDVLKAIVSDRHAVQDTLWVNGTPVGDFIMCALDEEIDLDELQNAPYRCKKTDDMFDEVKALRDAVRDLGKHLEPEFHYQMRKKHADTIKKCDEQNDQR